ncbi:hypothetical protein AGMMS49992_08540 [Clostridia bacterium]|nr:hypothetical protein AGMMS49992_08540 [Clostridia bacterium]
MRWIRANWIRVLAMVIVAAMGLAMLSGCTFKAPWANQTTGEEDGSTSDQTDVPLPTPNNAPTPTPRFTPEPTITPRPIDMAVETAAPGATPMLIEPVDKPKYTFVYTEYVSTSLGLTFNVPEGWIETALADDTVQFTEPQGSALEGYPASLIVKCVHNASNQTSTDAIDALNGMVESLKLNWPNIEMSQRDNTNKILGEPGYYYNFRIAQENAKPIRGRVIVAAVNRLLISIQLLSTATFSSDYMDIVREVRTTIKQ